MLRKLATNSAYNLLGGLAPALANLAAVPFIVKGLGGEDYGLLVLVTAVTGYFAIIDVNLTAGAVKYVSAHTALNQLRERNQAITLGLSFYLLLGLVGMACLYFFAWPITHALVASSHAEPQQVAAALRLASFGFLFSQLLLMATSIPQALQRYDISGKLESWFGSLVPLATVLVVMAGGELYEVVGLRVVASLVNLLVAARICATLLPDFHFQWPTGAVARQLFAFSGYAYAARLLSTTFYHADKLIISRLSGATALAFYSVPFTLTTRVFGLTFRLGGVLFPAASALHATNEHESLSRIYLLSTRYVCYISTLFAMLLCLFSHELLAWWISTDFADQGQYPMILLTLALYVDSLTNLPALVTDGVGRPSVTAFFAVLRAIIMIPAVYFATLQWGITGAAGGSLFAICLTTVPLLIYVHGHTIPVKLTRVIKVGYFHVFSAAFITVSFVLLANLAIPASTRWQFTLLFVSAAIYMALGYRYVLSPEHKAALVAKMRQRVSNM